MAIPLLRVRAVSQGWNGAPGLSTFYFAFNDSATPVTLETAQESADRVHAYFLAVIAAYPTTWALQIDPAVDVLDAASGELVAQWAVAAPAVVNGSSAQGFGPSAAMIVVGLLTAGIANGKRVRGRVFNGPLVGEADNDGTPMATFTQVFRDAGALLTAHTAGEPAWSVWHRPVAGAGGSPHEITGVAVRDSYAVLRSRRD